jgi:hypothetical protein
LDTVALHFVPFLSNVFGIKIIEKAIYCEFCGVHVKVLNERYEYLKNMGEWFK